MFLLFVVLIAGLAIYRQQTATPAPTRLLDRLPARLAAPLRRLSSSFAEGINWPRGWRGAAVAIGSITIKLLAVTQFIWAGLAFGITLQPAQYLFIMVFVGSLVILGHFARVAGSFIIGGLFVLGLLGVPEEQALAMVLVVEAANLLSVAGIGALALWGQGVAISDVRAEAAMRRG